MTPVVVRVAIAMSIALAGWSVGRAQSQVADFEMTITAPVGRTVVECSKGCDFRFDMGDTSLPRPNTRFTFECRGQGAQNCSATINGHGHAGMLRR
jgi:hypothetical protein